MRRKLAALLIIIGFGGSALVQIFSPAATAAGQGHINVLEISGIIDPISASYLARGLDKASNEEAHLVILLLDTPGGLLSSTRDMVEELLASEVPVAVYVSPAGAQAASAGTFITAAANFAAMAPGTNIGAATPVAGGGQDLPETLASKVTQDAAAFMRSIAEERGRNVDALEDTVLNARSFSATEAVKDNVVDFIADSLDDLVSLLDGRSVTTPSGTLTLHTKGLPLRTIDMNLLERFLSIIANPDIALLLLSIGSLGIMIEFLSPGAIFPGVFGAIALVMAFVALGNLPFNWAGLGLILFAMLLLFLELQDPGIGIFGVGGVISFALGAFLLFGGFGTPAIPTPSFRVSMWLIAVLAALLLGFVLSFFRLVYASRYRKGISTAETVVGQVGIAASDLAPTGTVQLASELWTAVADDDKVIKSGEKVKVVGLEGLTLRVSKTSE